MDDQNYLKKELYQLIEGDAHIFDFICEVSLDGIWYWDLENPDNEWMSPDFWQLLGYDAKTKSHNPKEWQDIIFQQDLQVALDNFNRHIEDANYRYDQVVRYKHKQGHTIWVRCRGMAIRDKQGKPIRMFGAHTDITDLKQVELKLENSKRFLQLVFDQIPNILFVKDQNFNIVQANKSFLSLYPPDQKDKIIGHTTVEKYSKEDAEAFVQKDRSAFSQGYSEVKENICFPNGQQRLLNTKKIRFEDSNKDSFILGISTDITDQEKANRVKDDFISNVNHEMRTPLTAIKGSIKILKQLLTQRLSEKELQLFAMCESNIDQLTSLLSDMLDADKIAQGKMQYVFDRYSVDELIGEAIEMNQGYAQKYGCKIIANLDCPSVFVRVDRTRILQVLTNLLSNAIKFSPPNEPVVIRSAFDQNKALIMVEDLGPGIPCDDKDVIFDRFTQLNQDSNQSRVGTGLGLNIAQSIVTNLNGHLSVEDNQPHGSIFIISLNTIT